MSAVLEGVAWGHTRGFLPMVATAQRFDERHGGMHVRWQQRSLHEFGHGDVADLARRFDLVVVDHPWMGFAAARGCFAPVRAHVERSVVDEWRHGSVGASFASYVWDDTLWAVPIDAASPAAFVGVGGGGRPAVDLPDRWDDVVELARAGRVVMPCFPPDLLLHLFMLMEGASVPLFAADDAFAPREVTHEAMDRLRVLVERLPTWCDTANPIAVHEAIAAGAADYCPCAYTYATYARRGYAARRVRFLDLPARSDGAPLRGVLGGTGLAVSAGCERPELAFDYVRFVAAADTQAGIYAYAGGQPAHVTAWDDPVLDDHVGGFLTATRPAIERAWVRPRFYGYPLFQEEAGRPLLRWTRGDLSTKACLDEMETWYRRSRALAAPDPVRHTSAG